jgi:hypothetical protein
VRAAAAVFLATALAQPVRAAPPDELFDPLKAIEYDLYDFAPEEQAAWEASRYAANAVRLDLGSVTLKELFAIQEAQANLRALPWLGFHLDVQDDRTREAEVARFSADVLLRVAPGVELAVSGTPDVVKQDSAIGGALLLTSADRTRYAIVRVLDDAAFFNLQNPSGAHRDSPVWRAQAEARWAAGAFSTWVRADVGTRNDVRFPFAPPQGVQRASDQRSDVDAHFRWAQGGISAGIRVTARRLDFGRTEQGEERALRRGFAYGRAYLLAPVLPALAMRAVALGWREQARGIDAGSPYSFSRWDLGGRAGAVWTPSDWTFEGGYARVHSSQDLDGAPLDGWGDKLYGTARWSPRERVRLHFLISHQVTTGRFGGFNGGLEVIF